MSITKQDYEKIVYTLAMRIYKMPLNKQDLILDTFQHVLSTLQPYNFSPVKFICKVNNIVQEQRQKHKLNKQITDYTP